MRRKDLLKDLRRRNLKDVSFNDYLRRTAADHIDALEKDMRAIIKAFPLVKEEGSISIQDMMKSMIEMHYIAVRSLEKKI